nr:hypothetical protein [uncultured Fluviicola sp.]
MKANIVRLIHDDIKISRLIGVLEHLDIHATSYYLGNSAVIFSLMGIEDNEQNKEFYQLLVEKADDLEKYQTPDALKEFAEEIYAELGVLG